jgi:P-type conjugative transfer protein TrbL
MGFTSFFDNFVQIAILLIAWLIVVISFFIMAIQLFVSLIEFKLTTLAGFVLVPFGLFGRTAFLAEKVLGNVVSSGVKILVLAVIIGIGSTIFGQFTSGFNNPPTISDALTLILAALVAARPVHLRPRHRQRPDRRRPAARRRRGRRDGTGGRRHRRGRRWSRRRRHSAPRAA